MKKVTAVFDIGKTNKKFFLFDEKLQEVYRVYKSFEEVSDEDGYPTEDIKKLSEWVKNTFDEVMSSGHYDVKALNFSSYGASMVHIDEQANILTPLYNYTKPIPQQIIKSFYKKYGPETAFLSITGSDNAGMLNAGMQLYWLKKTQPKVYEKIKFSMHLPQYLSYLFTGVAVSEYTSIGCHTTLWDYSGKDYHPWVYAEGIDTKLPPIVPSKKIFQIIINNRYVDVGVGLHDSSSALLPYLESIKEKFLLISTGTWSITLNPFVKKPLIDEDVIQNTINYMSIEGKPIKASRLFLGKEFKHQIDQLQKQFGLASDYYKTIPFEPEIFKSVLKIFKPSFRWKYIHTNNNPPESKNNSFSTFKHAYYHLMIALVTEQIKCIQIAVSGVEIESIYIDGGFGTNDIFVKVLHHYLKDIELCVTNASLGTALGAAIIVINTPLSKTFLKENYALKKLKHNIYTMN